MAVGVVSHASSLLRGLLFYVCCCLNHEENSELCRDWVDHPNDGVEREESGIREEEGERGVV